MQFPSSYERPGLLPRAMGSSGLELLPRPMSESIALLQSGSVLMSMVPVTIRGYVNAWGVNPHLRLCWGPSATL